MLDLSKCLLLCMTSLINGSLHVLERAFRRIDGEEHLCRFLLNHRNVIHNSLVVRLKVKCLWKKSTTQEFKWATNITICAYFKDVFIAEND